MKFQDYAKVQLGIDTEISLAKLWELLNGPLVDDDLTSPTPLHAMQKNKNFPLNIRQFAHALFHINLSDRSEGNFTDFMFDIIHNHGLIKTYSLESIEDEQLVIRHALRAFINNGRLENDNNLLETLQVLDLYGVFFDFECTSDPKTTCNWHFEYTQRVTEHRNSFNRECNFLMDQPGFPEKLKPAFRRIMVCNDEYSPEKDVINLLNTFADFAFLLSKNS
jgi:hypothetical protein